MRAAETFVLAGLVCLAPITMHAADPQAGYAVKINDDRAEYHYKMHCQGCHTPDGSGGAGVPAMRDFVGHFTRTENGRAYLVRVPGAAYSVLDDESLAEVINWLLLEFSGDSLPGNFIPYSSEEVAQYRRDPLLELVEYREHMLQEISVKIQ
jgi:mono/diheme cytochrome c family protein